MLSIKFDIFYPLLAALRGIAQPPEPSPPRELQRILDELRLAREKERALALMHRLYGG